MTRPFKALFVTLVFVYLYAPIAVLVVNSFNASKYGVKSKLLVPGILRPFRSAK